MSVNRKQRSDVFWSALETFGSTGLAMVTTIMVARLLGPGDFGLIMSALAFVQIGAFFAENAFNDALVRRRHLSEVHVHSAYLASIGLGAAFGLGFAAFAGTIAALFEAPYLTPAVIAMSATLLCNGLSSVPMSLLRRDLRFRELALRTLYARVAGAATAIIGLAAGLGIWAVVWQQVVAAVVSAACLLPFARPALSGRFSLAALRELAPMSVFSNANQLIGFIGHRVYLTVISVLFGPTALGLFTIGVRIVDTLRSMIHHSAVQLIFRRLAIRQDDPAALREVYLTATRLGASLAVPIFAGLFVTAPQLVQILLQPQWSAAVGVIRLFSLGSALVCLQMFNGTLHNALGRAEVGLVVTIVAVVLGFGFLYALHAMGSAAVEQAWFARAVVGYMCSMLAVWYDTGIPPIRQFQAQAPVMASAGTMIVVLMLVATWLPPTLAPAATLAVIVPLGVIVHGVLLQILAPATVLRIRRLAFGG